ncbi:MAG: TadE/TadG family type IV pilus assembly protein [Moorellales bacterium]
MRRYAHVLRSRRGQAVVELALVLPVLLLLLLGTWETADILHKYLVLTGAAREGARLGAVGATDAEIRERVKAVGASLGLEDGDITLSPEEGERRPGEPLSVEVRTEVKLLTPILSGVLPNPFPLKVQTVMRVE